MPPQKPTVSPERPFSLHSFARDLEGMQQQIFECLSLGVVVFDARLSILYMNPAAAGLLPSAAGLDESLQAAALESHYQDWARTLSGVIQDRREQRLGPIVFRPTPSDERLLELLLFPLTDSGGSATGGILLLEDVTAQAGLEKRLAVSERMAAVGKLAARVAHELNNPLDGILRYLNLAVRAVDVGKTERLRDYLVQARGGLVRMAEIIRELVEFSRSSYTAFDDTGINSAVEEAIKVMSDRADAAGVSIVCRLEQNMPAVRSAGLFQVFCNLIKNAIDAMPDGGTLTILTQTVGSEVVIRFEDTGIGLPGEMDRLFEPFFTTKPPGKGTGLGLAICKDMIEKYNGRITPARRPEGGSVFTIRIPLESCARLRQPGPRSGLGPVSEQASGDKS
jgi:signal transduction histidine kinase